MWKAQKLEATSWKRAKKQQRRANFLRKSAAVAEDCPLKNCRCHCVCVGRVACNTRSHQNFTIFPKYAQCALVAQLAAHKTHWSSLWKWFIAILVRVELQANRTMRARRKRGGTMEWKVKKSYWRAREGRTRRRTKMSEFLQRTRYAVAAELIRAYRTYFEDKKGR